jgi:hypothetical protein
MLRIGFLLSLLLLVNSDDCDPQKQNQRISSLESEVKQLKDKVAELEQKQPATPEHRYELRNEGFRTFRFDPATGDTCIQLPLMPIGSARRRSRKAVRARMRQNTTSGCSSARTKHKVTSTLSLNRLAGPDRGRM